MSGIQMALLAGSPNLAASFNSSVSNVGTTTGSYTAGFNLNSDGSAANSNGVGATSSTWINTPYAGVGSRVWVSASTPTGGGTFSLTPGTWYSLASNVLVTMRNTSTTIEYTGSITFTFATDSGGVNQIGTGNWNYDVGKTS